MSQPGYVQAVLADDYKRELIGRLFCFLVHRRPTLLMSHREPPHPLLQQGESRVEMASQRMVSAKPDGESEGAKSLGGQTSNR
jgi:hypothetical protein